MEVTQRQITEKGLGVAMMSARVIFLHLLHIYSLISINGKKTHCEGWTDWFGHILDDHQCIGRCDNGV